MRRHIHAVIVGLLAGSLAFDTARAARHGRCRVATRASSSRVCEPPARDWCTVVDPCAGSVHTACSNDSHVVVDGGCVPCACLTECCGPSAGDHLAVMAGGTASESSSSIAHGDAVIVETTPPVTRSDDAAAAGSTPAAGGPAPKPAGAATSVLVPESADVPAVGNAPQPTEEPTLQPVEPKPDAKVGADDEPVAPAESAGKPDAKPEMKEPGTAPESAEEPTEKPAAPVAPPVPNAPAPPPPPAKPREENLFDDEPTAEEATDPAPSAAADPVTPEPAEKPTASADAAPEADAPTDTAADPAAAAESDTVVPEVGEPAAASEPAESEPSAAPEAEPAPSEPVEAPASDAASVGESLPTRASVLEPPAEARPARRRGPPLRRWVDDRGDHATVGRFLGFRDDAVEIQKTDGRVIRVPLERLSELDRDYVGALADRSTGPAVADTVGM